MIFPAAEEDRVVHDPAVPCREEHILALSDRALLHVPRRLFFSSRRRHTRYNGDWSSDVCSSDLLPVLVLLTSSDSKQWRLCHAELAELGIQVQCSTHNNGFLERFIKSVRGEFLHTKAKHPGLEDRKSTRLNSSHRCTSYAGFCLK